MPTIFADKKKIAQYAGGDEIGEMLNEYETQEHMQIFQFLAKDIMAALKAGSASDLARALKLFFAECEEEPHYEGEHLED